MSIQPPKLAFDLARDVRILSAMASNLTPYLYENEMYGYLSGDLPKLTLGGVLLRLYRLNRLGHLLDADQRSRVQQAQHQFETERIQWAAHYEMKLPRELGKRIHALDVFLQECHEDLQACAAGYPTQAEKRTMIEHLAAESGLRNCLDEELRTHLTQVDNKLRRSLEDGMFVFIDERLKEVYPPDQFWWLYGHIAEGRP
jgi:hypothetical protein